jgi:hypothetical protein
VIPWYGFVVLEDDANIWEGWSKCDSDFNTEYFHPSELVAIFHYDNNARSISSFNRFEDDYTVASTRNSTASESDGSPALRGGGDTQAALLNGTEESDCELDMMAASAEALPPAFHESELLLLSIYLRAYTLHAFHGATHTSQFQNFWKVNMLCYAISLQNTAFLTRASRRWLAPFQLSSIVLVSIQGDSSRTTSFV